MMNRQHEPLRRPRPRSRLGRGDGTPSPQPRADREAAQRVACRYVADHWPDLAEVAPVVTARRQHLPDRETLARLGLSEVVLRTPDSTEYIVTFAREAPTADSPVAPLVASVTVDSRRRVVKTALSK